jgi:APA family basic amino acid/polyamine antiporter
MVVGIYVAVNIAMMFVLSVNNMGHSQIVASDAAVKTLGPAGAVVVSLAVIISTFGTNNGFIFTCPRIYYAMAKEGLFFKGLSSIHPKYQTPIPSLIAQAILSCAFILSGTYDQLYTYVVFTSWIFYAMTAGAVFLFRRKTPDVPRPYRTSGYPFTTFIFILFALGLVIFTIVEDPQDSLVGLGIVLIGMPAYFYWKKKIGEIN